MRTMLDASGNLALWYTGEVIVVFDFGSNTEVWREAVKCKKSKDTNFAFTKNNLILHTDYGAMSIYRCTL